MNATTRVGIVSPGDMGAGTGWKLGQSGAEVFASLQGRSELSRTRAAEAGITDAGSMDELVARVDIVLSILVPAEARAIAAQVAAAMQRTGAKPVYVDCNAIAPQTVCEIEAAIAEAGAAFIDAGIIGGPPGPGSSPRFYCSGPDTAAFEALRDCGLDVRRVSGRVGDASALKMVYAASTKGTTALWTELMTAARALGVEDALRGEFGEGNAAVARNLAAIPSMPRRAARWVGEMEEIAATFEATGLTPRILAGAADMYRLVSDTPLAKQTSREPDPSLDEILDVLTGKLEG